MMQNAPPNTTQNFKHIKNHDLSSCNTMALSCIASDCVHIYTEQQAIEFVNQYNQNDLHLNKKLLVLSGGSNVLLPPELNAFVLRPLMKGITKIKENDETAFIEVMAGENWHDWVLTSINNGWYGLENMALIPGLVGAGPVQNIGAYGIEVSDFFESLTAINLHDGRCKEFSHAECQFNYRDSFFKQHPNQWLITKVVFRLNKQPKINLKYQDVATIASNIASQNNLDAPTPMCVAQAITQIRQQKLPDPDELANCGSFFTNPIISKEKYQTLIKHYPNMPSYPQANDTYKLAAGWLIDKSGLKGHVINHVGTHKNQALVVVNHAPQVTQQNDIIQFSDFIKQSVFDKFNVTLEREPIRINTDGTFA